MDSTPREVAPRDVASRLERARRLAHIDGLRAVAVLSVVAFHTGWHDAALRAGPAWLVHVVGEGAHGVDLFFVLSGFCLAHPQIEALHREGVARFDAVRYAAHRIVRIIPPFYIAASILAIIAMALAASGVALPDAYRPPHSPIAFVKLLLFADDHAVAVNPSFWTLAVEFRWYLLFPLLLALWVRSPRAFAAVGLAVLYAYHVTRARSIDLGTLPLFMLGIVAADVHVRRARIARFALPLALASLACGLVAEPSATVPGFIGEGEFNAYSQPTILGWQLAMFFFVVAAGELAWLRRLLSLRALVAIGIASYSIYLVHEPIVAIIDLRVGHPASLLGAPLAVLVGFAFWCIFERPFVTGSLRRRSIAALTVPCTRAFAFLGIPDSLCLDRRAAEPPAVVRLPASTR